MQYFTVATAGHVDHGKTSLLRALTGIDPDRLKEEKERQMTTDLGFAHLQIEDMVVGFIDVPGHGKFLKNMLAGVGGIDMALLVVAGDEGPMPQTVQHVRILSFLGVTRVIVAPNKIDVCSPEQIEISREKTKQLLNEHGIQVAGITPVSAVKEMGIAELKKCIGDVCASRNGNIQSNSKLFLPIDRAFTKQGFGTVVTGTLVGGELKTGDNILVGVKNTRAKIRKLESFGQTVERAVIGQRVAVNLAIKESLVRGDVLLADPMQAANVIVVSLVVPHGHDGEVNGQDIRLYHGTAEIIGNIRFVETIKNQSEKMAKIALVSPMVARAGDRVIIRLADDTICGGTILSLDPPRWLTRTKLPAFVAELLSGRYESAVMAYLQMCPQGLCRTSDIQRLLPEKVTAQLENWLNEKKLVQVNDFVMTGKRQDEFAASVLAIVSANSPVGLESVRGKVMPSINREVFQSVIQKLVALSKVEVRGDKLVRPGTAELDAGFVERDKLRMQIRDILSQETCLEIEEIARRVRVNAALVRTALTDMAKEKQAAIVAYEFASIASSIEKCHQTAAQLWKNRGDIAPGEFREALGVSRKYAMALLSYLDDQQITRRLPSGRVLLREPSN